MVSRGFPTADVSSTVPQNGIPDSSGNQAPAALSVSAAMALAKRSLESVTVRMLGEVSEVSIKAGYKAAYFTVKDSSASLPCMMWNNRYRASGVQLTVGQMVELEGRFTLYAAKGRMNFEVFSITLAGEGNLRLKVANIAKKLQAEGLTDPARKRPLPLFPEKIGLVTSPRSAAVHDVLRTLRRRFPIATIYLAGVPVEGVQAPAGIIEGLHCVVNAGSQVVLIVRGGGSFEDMMPFNDENLARAIAACPVPVVTGIGHEVDTAIADMVSDYRASTPTAAAEAVSPSRESLDVQFQSQADALATSVRRVIAAQKAFIERASDRPAFRDPAFLFSSEAQALDASMERLNRAVPAVLEKNATSVATARQRLISVGPYITDRPQAELARGAARLEDLSPIKTLARGYSVTRDENGKIVSSIDQTQIGQRVIVSLVDGRLDCAVGDIDEIDLFGRNKEIKHG